VQEQLEEMLADHIIEESYSSYVNPLTLVQREGKRVRICLDAREVNKFMTPDRAKVPPMQMLLQRFHGASYFSTLDLSSAFLQIPLEESSRKWAAFQFQNKLYQFTRVPYGFKHSLSVLLGHFSQCWVLITVNTRFIMYTTAYEKKDGKKTQKKASEKLYCIVLYFSALRGEKFEYIVNQILDVKLVLNIPHRSNFSFFKNINLNECI
jgi:hypothetical protein